MSNTIETYTSSSVAVLSDLDHIRQRPGMYIDEQINPKHLLKEALDNSLDECQNGHATVVVVSADTKQHIYSVYDEGRGIPIGITKYEYNGIPIEMETLQVLTTVGKAGGKFDNNNYKIRGGLHGLGNKCITALTEWAIFETRRDGKLVRVRTKDGNFSSLEYEDTTLPNGVSVKFKANPDVFDEVVIPISQLYEFCNIATAFGYPVKLLIDGEEQELHAKELIDLVPEDTSLSEYSRGNIIVTDENTGEGFRVAFKYTSDINSKSYGYANLIPNKYGGTHVKAIEKAIEEVWSEFYSECEVELKPYDCRLGLRSVIAISISDPSFLGQTKDKFNNKVSEFSHLVTKFKTEFKKYLVDHEDIRKALLKRFAEYRVSQNSLLARKEIMSLIKINEPLDSTGKIRRRSVVTSLLECKQTSAEGTELHLVEGESAGGGLGRARDKNTQAILPLGGKIKNVAYCSINDALKSEDIRNIVNSIGAGVGPSADPRRSRYGDILIDCDADPDGKHITALVICAFIKLLPELVKAGMVWVVSAPLFGYTEGKTRHYTNIFEKIPANAKDFTRYKGLGEYDDDELKDTILNPKNRIMTQVQYPSDVDEFFRILGTSGGKSDLLTDLGVIKYI